MQNPSLCNTKAPAVPVACETNAAVPSRAALQLFCALLAPVFKWPM